MAEICHNGYYAASPRLRRDNSAVVRAVADRWNRTGINYAVANGLEGYPQSMGRDLDVVVDPRHLRAASEIVRTTFQQYGRQLIVRQRRELVQHIGMSSNSGDALVVDLFPGLRWGPVWLIKLPRPSRPRNGFAVDPWASFVKRIMLHALVAPTAKFGAAAERLRLSDAERIAASQSLPPLIGDNLAAETLTAIYDRDVAALAELRPRLRRALIIRAFLRQPFHALRTSGQWLSARLSVAFCPPAMPIVSVVGPDGVGKSTLITEVARQAQRRLRCTRVELRHWRPGLLPQLGTLIGRPVPRGCTPPRRTPGRWGLLRILYYGIDFVIGSRLRDRRVSRDLGLVVYDRGALDMYVDPLRYGLPSGRAIRVLLRFVPRPDLVVLLRDEPARIRERKAELEEAEIRRQLHEWEKLVGAGEVDMVLNVDAPPAVMAHQVVNRLVELFMARNGIDRS